MRWFAGCAATSALLGLLVAVLLGAPPGADHSCPGGSSASDCHYPAHTVVWLAGWGVGGAVVGLLVGWYLWSGFGLGRRD